MAAVYNITVNQNSDFNRSFQLKEADIILDISNYTVEGSLKPNHNSTTTVDFTASITDGPAGVFSLSLSDTVTETMTPGNWVYDVVITDTALQKTRLLEGTAIVKAGVTQ